MYERKKSTLLVICLVLFLELNCISYFVRRHGSNLLRSQSDFVETIGFPFLIAEIGGIQGLSVFRWYGLVADILIAIVFSYVIAGMCAHRLPPTLMLESVVPIWRRQKTMIVVIVCLAVSFSVGYLDVGLRAGICDTARFFGPVAIGAIWLWEGRASWSWLVGYAICLILVIVGLDKHASLFDWYVSRDVVVVVHAFVPVVGLLSAIVIGDTALRYLRWRDEGVVVRRVLTTDAKENRTPHDGDGKDENKTIM